MLSDEPVWAQQLLNNKYNWMLAGCNSNLAIAFGDHYAPYTGRINPAQVTEPLEDPDTLLNYLPKQTVVSLGKFCHDCKNNIRVLSLRWGQGEFVVAPDACLKNILVHLKRGEAVAGEEPAAPAQAGDIPAVTTSVANKSQRRANLNIAKMYKDKAFEIWESYRKDDIGMARYADCFEPNKERLKDMGISSADDFERVCDSVRKSKKKIRKRL